ncbi:MAG: TraX family protein [Christensenellales bacterium]|jgi:hypothetical protein
MAKAKGEIRLNTDTGFLKLLAIFFMAIDHAGKALFPQYAILRIIGRLAFPLFAYCLTVGCCYTHSMPKYILRVALLAILSQPIYAVALSHTTPAMNAIMESGEWTARNAWVFYAQSWSHPSILLSILYGLFVLWSLREEKYIATALLLLGLLYLHLYLDYGWKGIVLMALFYLFREKPLTSLVWVGGFMLWWGISSGGGYSLFGVRFGIQAFAVFALPLIYIPTSTGIKGGKWLFYLFYPAHLIVIAVLRHFL